jgi:hypothetical protein
MATDEGKKIENKTKQIGKGNFSLTNSLSFLLLEALLSCSTPKNVQEYRCFF